MMIGDQTFPNYFATATNPEAADARWEVVRTLAAEVFLASYGYQLHNDDHLRLWFAGYATGACKEGLEDLESYLGRNTLDLTEIGRNDESIAEHAANHIPSFLLPASLRASYERAIARFMDTYEEDEEDEEDEEEDGAVAFASARGGATRYAQAFAPSLLQQFTEFPSTDMFNVYWTTHFRPAVVSALRNQGLDPEKLPEWGLRCLFLASMETDNPAILQAILAWAQEQHDVDVPTPPRGYARYLAQIQRSPWRFYLPPIRSV
jgi:hypothetical protein